MVSETGTFGSATLVVLAGLVVMLYGVSLNNGVAFDLPMVVGGGIVIVGVIILMLGVLRLEEPEAAE